MVPPQGAYVARRCPVRAHNDNDPTVPDADQVPFSEAAQLRIDEGNRFETEVAGELGARHGSDFVRVEESRADARRAATVAAMDAGARLIFGGELPLDVTGCRVGKPDVLIRAEYSKGRWTYRAADIKSHHAIQDREGERLPAALVASLARPWRECAVESPERSANLAHRDDWLQLAHYQRMLQACGRAAPGVAWGAVLGTEREVVWVDLDRACWQPWDEKRRASRPLESTLERYDFEFAFRLSIIAAARATPGAKGPPPVKIGECAECDWRDYCARELEAKDDVSLLPRIGWRGWALHRDHGIGSRRELASLDWRTADLIAQGVDVIDFIEKAERVAPETPVSELLPVRRSRQAAKLAAAGIDRASDAKRVCPRTAAYGDRSPTSLPEQIDQARAACEARPFRRRDVNHVKVPRGDVEVDVDMENAPDGGVYLWGALVTTRLSQTGVGRDGYWPFCTWESIRERVEQEAMIFAAFWGWLTTIRAEVEQQGRSFRAYCYSAAAAENKQLTALAQRHAGQPGVPTVADVDAFIDSAVWVDLEATVKKQIITGGSTGLKSAARLAGFRWRDDDAGGDNSLVWYRDALAGSDAASREANRKRLLAYNEDDVRATLRLREWLTADASTLTNIAVLDRSWPAHRAARAV